MPDFKVSLVGPGAGGKTALLATLVESAMRQRHGYPPDLQLRVVARHPSGHTPEEYIRLARAHLDGIWQATSLDGVYEYWFELSRRMNGNTLTDRVVVHDSSGDLFFPSSLDRLDQPPYDRAILSASLHTIAASDGIIFVIPLDEVSHHRIDRAMTNFCHMLGELPEKNVAITLSQSDKLMATEDAVTRTGPEELSPLAVRHLIRSNLLNLPWIERLRLFDKDFGGVHRIRLLLTSAVGIRHNYPILTADPFVFAATSQSNKYMVELGDLFQQRDSGTTDVPPQRPAAIQPIWRDGLLILPEGSPVDLKDRSFVAALKALRADIVAFAEDVAADANIDRRFVQYLRTLASQIPEKRLQQHELFRLGHAGAVLNRYTKTVNEQWPDFLAARFHGLSLQFDRTMRQSPLWRQLKRNAEHGRMTYQQVADTAPLADLVVAALRNEELVDGAIPRALEELARPLKAGIDNGSMPDEFAEDTSAERAYDVVESINNILKRIVEAALAGKAFLGRAANLAHDAASEYGKGFADRLPKASRKLGGEHGDKLPKLIFRLVTGGTIAGVSIPYIISKFPEAFAWLQRALSALH